MIDSKADICCGNEVQSRSYGDKTGCCRVGGKSISEISGEVNENLLDKILGGGHVTYDKTRSRCCSGQLNFNKYGGDAACCGKTLYDTKTQVCCSNEVRTFFFNQNLNPVRIYCLIKKPTFD